MSFILRLVLILIVFSFVVYVLKAISRLSFRLRGTMREVSRMRDRMPDPGTVSAEMVRCESCGAFVSRRDSVQLRVRNQSLSYCSELCLKTHKLGA